MIAAPFLMDLLQMAGNCRCRNWQGKFAEAHALLVADCLQTADKDFVLDKAAALVKCLCLAHTD